MRINQILLVPEFSGVGKDGNAWGNHNQKDVVRAYLDTLSEHIDENRHRFSIYREGDTILPNSLILCLSSGWAKTDSKAKLNGHTVHYGRSLSAEFAEIMAECVADWAKNYVNFHHKNSGPSISTANPFLNVEDTIAISVSPFKLNGVNSADYYRWLPKLGEHMAHCIYEFLLTRGEQPRMMSVTYPLGSR